jgi:uncharacterized protein YegL
MSIGLARLQREATITPDPRCPFVLLVDTSLSMAGEKIDNVNAGLRTFQMELQNDVLAKRRVEIALVKFDTTVEVVQDWVSAGSFQAPSLHVAPATSLGEAVLRGVSMVQSRKADYKQVGLKSYRPLILLITDGEPTDGEVWREGAKAIKAEMASPGGLNFMAIAVGKDAKLNVLKALTDSVYELNGFNFKELFVFISSSLASRSQGKADPASTSLAIVPFGVLR